MKRFFRINYRELSVTIIIACWLAIGFAGAYLFWLIWKKSELPKDTTEGEDENTYPWQGDEENDVCMGCGAPGSRLCRRCAGN